LEQPAPHATDSVVLDIPRDLLDAMVAHCLREAPLECCGILGGIAPRVSSFHPLRNAAASETRYDADPHDLIAVVVALRERQAEILAIYHSHPRWQAVPSQTDLRENHYGPVPRIIVSLLDEPPDVRVWRLDPDSYQELPWRLLAPLCASPVIKEIHELILKAERRFRNRVARRRGATAKQEAHFLSQHRHLIVSRREGFTEGDRAHLTAMIEYLPELAVLRRFADRVDWLFDTPKDYHQASCRRSAILREKAFQKVPELVKAMEQIEPAKFAKVMAYLKKPVSRRATSRAPALDVASTATAD
jgi:proteasome lid subunit RPN8/RPN11